MQECTFRIVSLYRWFVKINQSINNANQWSNALWNSWMPSKTYTRTIMQTSQNIFSILEYSSTNYDVLSCSTIENIVILINCTITQRIAYNSTLTCASPSWLTSLRNLSTDLYVCMSMTGEQSMAQLLAKLAISIKRLSSMLTLVETACTSSHRYLRYRSKLCFTI